MLAKTLMFIPTALLCASPALAECDLDEVVGYTLVGKKTVTGRIDNGKRSDDYEGCDYDRVLILDDTIGLQCGEYDYNYAYRPDAYIFVSGSLMKACIDGELLDVAPLR